MDYPHLSCSSLLLLSCLFFCDFKIKCKQLMAFPIETSHLLCQIFFLFARPHIVTLSHTVKDSHINGPHHIRSPVNLATAGSTRHFLFGAMNLFIVPLFSQPPPLPFFIPLAVSQALTSSVFRYPVTPHRCSIYPNPLCSSSSSSSSPSSLLPRRPE